MKEKKKNAGKRKGYERWDWWVEHDDERMNKL